MTKFRIAANQIGGYTCLKIKIVFFLLFSIIVVMAQPKEEIHPSGLISCVGKSINTQRLFNDSDFLQASKEDANAYFPILIHKTLRSPERFTLFKIPIDQLHINIDDKGVIVALFVKLNNIDLLARMVKAIGGEYMASGMGVDDHPVKESFFMWDYKGACVSLNLNANKVRFKPNVVRDEGLVVFYNCDMLSYLKVPK